MKGRGYAQTPICLDRIIGKDKVWDNWRLEGPAFVWHFRGAPHVHCWVNVADNPEVELNAG